MSKNLSQFLQNSISKLTPYQMPKVGLEVKAPKLQS